MSSLVLRRRRTAGFSLIELIVVILIIGVLLIGWHLSAFLRQRQTTQDRAAQAELTTAGKQISAFYLAHGESFDDIEFEDGEESGVPTNVAPDWPSHAGETIRARVVDKDVACLEAVTPRGQKWTLVVVMNPVSDPEIPAGRWWGAGPASNWCDDTTSISDSIDSDGDGFSDAVEGAQGTDPNDPTDTPSGEPSDGLLTPPGTGSSSTSPTTAPPAGGEGPNTTTVTESVRVPARQNILDLGNGDWEIYCPPGYDIVGGSYVATPPGIAYISDDIDYFMRMYWVWVDNSSGDVDVFVVATVECEESTDSGSGDGAPVETGFSPTGWGFCQPGGYYWAEGTVGNYDHITAVFSYGGPAAPGEGNATVQLGPDDWVGAGDDAVWVVILYADDIEGYDPNLVDYTWSFWHNGDRIGVASNYGYDEQCPYGHALGA